MSLQGILFQITATSSDRKRNAATTHPEGVTCCANISYGPYGKESLLNVYYPENTVQTLPTIVSIHGGGYVYGNKEVYHHYCADLARRGFTVVNFNYRLAPKAHFPAPLEDINAVMNWLIRHADRYHMDPQRLFLVGDSAGAQLCSHYAAIWSNPDYARLFSFMVPDVNLLAVGLNCGMYEISATKDKGLITDYLGKKINPNDPRLNILGNISSSFPPAHITTAHHDFLRECAQPMFDLLVSKGVPASITCYGSPEKKHIAHVFHVDIRNPEATECNDSQCAFFREYLK